MLTPIEFDEFSKSPLYPIIRRRVQSKEATNISSYRKFTNWVDPVISVDRYIDYLVANDVGAIQATRLLNKFSSIDAPWFLSSMLRVYDDKFIKELITLYEDQSEFNIKFPCISLVTDKTDGALKECHYEMKIADPSTYKTGIVKRRITVPNIHESIIDELHQSHQIDTNELMMEVIEYEMSNDIIRDIYNRIIADVDVKMLDAKCSGDEMRNCIVGNVVADGMPRMIIASTDVVMLMSSQSYFTNTFSYSSDVSSYSLCGTYLGIPVYRELCAHKGGFTVVRNKIYMSIGNYKHDDVTNVATVETDASDNRVSVSIPYIYSDVGCKMNVYRIDN